MAKRLAFFVITPIITLVTNKSKEETNLILFPATYYYLYESNSKDNYIKEKHFSLFHGKISETYKVNNKLRENSLWFPIVPIIRHTELEEKPI